MTLSFSTDLCNSLMRAEGEQLGLKAELGVAQIPTLRVRMAEETLRDPEKTLRGLWANWPALEGNSKSRHCFRSEVFWENFIRNDELIQVVQDIANI